MCVIYEFGGMRAADRNQRPHRGPTQPLRSVSRTSRHPNLWLRDGDRHGPICQGRQLLYTCPVADHHCSTATTESKVITNRCLTRCRSSIYMRKRAQQRWSTALLPPNTELLSLLPLDSMSRNGIPICHQAFHTIPNGFLSASLLCHVASHAYGYDYEHQSSRCDYR